LHCSGRSSLDSLPQPANGRFQALVSEGRPTGVGPVAAGRNSIAEHPASSSEEPRRSRRDLLRLFIGVPPRPDRCHLRRDSLHEAAIANSLSPLLTTDAVVEERNGETGLHVIAVKGLFHAVAPIVVGADPSATKAAGLGAAQDTPVRRVRARSTVRTSHASPWPRTEHCRSQAPPVPPRARRYRPASHRSAPAPPRFPAFRSPAADDRC
jgi:hypothetical protein